MSKKTKNEIQKEAVEAIKDHNGKGLVLVATGVGKSKIGIDWIKKYLDFCFNGVYGTSKVKDRYNFLIVVPTRELQKNTWKKEFELWGATDIYDKHITVVCYASLNKYQHENFDVVILDECQNITPNNSAFFDNNICKSVIGLTATYPRDLIKRNLLTKIGLEIIYKIDFDEAVEWGLVSPYQIQVITVPLEDRVETVKAGSKDKPFMTTEYANYHYITAQIHDIEKRNQMLAQMLWSKDDLHRIKMLRLKRMNMFKNSYTKSKVARYLLRNVIPKEQRTIIFAGSIEQANALCDYRYHSKSSNADFELFMQEKLTNISCVDKVNEGVNIPNLDCALIAQLNSNELDLIQRMGRIVRYREGHVGTVYIIVIENTVDFEWFKLATKNLDESNITYTPYSKLKELYD